MKKDVFLNEKIFFLMENMIVFMIFLNVFCVLCFFKKI